MPEYTEQEQQKWQDEIAKLTTQNQSIQTELTKLSERLGAMAPGNPTERAELKASIATLQAELTKRDERIAALETKLSEVTPPQPPAPPNPKSGAVDPPVPAPERRAAPGKWIR